MKRLRRHRLIPALTALFLWSLAAPSGAERDRATVMSVSDGDTIVVRLGMKRERVRLIGIDAPESSLNRKARRDAQRSGADVHVLVAQGRRAKSFVKSLIRKGDDVGLEYDIERRDRYRRLLAYVYLEDGRMLNEIIVREGYALVYTYPPNVRHRDRFRKAYRHARSTGAGLWSAE